MLGLLSASTLFTLVALVPALAESDETDLLPPLKSPRIHFGTGGTSAESLDGIQVYRDLPNIPGDDSLWTLVQWRKAYPLKPADFTTKAGTTPSFEWKSPDTNSELTISKGNSGYVYELIGGNGALDTTGESDIGLSAHVLSHSISAENALIFNMDVRLSAAEASYRTAHAKGLGVVLAQAGITFRTAFHDPVNREGYSVQIGIPLANSRDARPEHVGCHFFSQNRSPQLDSEKVLAGSTLLPFKVGQHMTHVTYRVNDYICDFISKPVPCRSGDGPQMLMKWPASAADLNNWSIGSVVISLGTQNSTSQRSNSGSQGDVKVGMEISDPRLTKSSELGHGYRCPMP